VINDSTLLTLIADVNNIQSMNLKGPKIKIHSYIVWDDIILQRKPNKNRTKRVTSTHILAFFSEKKIKSW